MLQHYAAIAIACTSIFANILPIYAQTQSPIATTVNSAAKSPFDRGVAKFESGDTVGAIKDLTAAIDRDPKYVDAYIYRGVIQGMQSQKLDLAVRDFDRAIQLAPQNSNAYLFRGFAKFMASPKSNFRGDFDRAIQLNPQSELNYLLLIFTAKHNDRDLRQFAKLLRQKPDILYYSVLVGSFPPATTKSRQFDTKTLSTAKAYIERGLDRLEDKVLDKHNLNAALADFDRAVALDSQNSDAYFYRSFFSSLGDMSKRNIDIDRAIAIDPQPARYYFLRGIFGMTGNPYTVLNDIERAIASAPQSYSLLGFRGLVKGSMLYEIEAARADIIAAAKLARQQGKLGEYFAIFLNIELAVKSATVDKKPDYLKLAKYQYRAGKQQQSLATLARVRATLNKQTKQEPQTYINLASARLEIDDLAEATTDLNTALAIDSKNIPALFLLARVKAKTNDKPGAIGLLDRITDIATKPSEIFNVAAYKFTKLDDRQSALADLNKGIARYPQAAFGYHILSAEIKAKIGDKQGAATDYDRAIKIKPDLPYGYINRAKFKAEYLKDKAGAFADYNKAISVDPKSANNVYVERGNVNRDIFKDFTSAIADYQQAIAGGNSYLQAEAYTEQANLYRDYLKDLPRALADYDRAISLAPSSTKPYYLRATLKHNLLKDNIGAIADYRSTLATARMYDISLEYEDLETRSIAALKQLNATQD
jgi:tetratricopeptide (TPR) repeat protein